MTYSFDNFSTWDLEHHIAIPTIDYIKNITGLDLATSGHELYTTAEAYIKRLTLEAKDELFFNKSTNTKMVLEYKIAYEQAYNTNWLRYVSQYIWASIFDSNDEKGKVKRAKKNIEDWNYTNSVISEVENSTLEW